MSIQAYVPSWGIKDPHSKRPKNFDARPELLKLGNPLISTATVEVTRAWNEDGESIALEDLEDDTLVISEVSYDNDLKRVSFVWAAGTLGWKYRVTCRITTATTAVLEQSADVLIDNK